MNYFIISFIFLSSLFFIGESLADENSTNKEITNQEIIPDQTEEKETKTNSKNWSVDVKNSLLFENNLLLKRNSSFFKFYENGVLSMPYTEINFNYELTDKLLFELEVDLSYSKQSAKLKWDDLFLKYSEDSFFIPFSFQWGKFRMGYIKSNSKLFHKKTLTRQALYLYGDRALGVSLEIKLIDSFSVLSGWQVHRKKRETDGFYPRHPSSVFSSYLLYKTDQQNIFAGTLRQDLLLEGVLSAYGTGADLNHSFRDWSFKLKTELWKIQKTEPKSNTLSYYLFPYVKWNFLGAGFVIGSSQESLSNNKGALFEKLIKMDFYFTKASYFSIERVQEYSSIFTKNSWGFSVKSNFQL